MCRASREGRHVLANVALDWETRAMAEHRALIASGDTRYAIRCAARTLERLHRELGAPPSIETWVFALDANLAQIGLDNCLVECEVLRAGLAVLGRCPRHPALPLWHARALAALRRRHTPADAALIAAGFAFEYAVRAGNFRQATEVVALAHAHSGGASMTIRLQWLEAEALEAWLSSDHRRANAAVSEALAIGGGYGTFEQAASIALSEGDTAKADRWLQAMARTLEVRRAQDVAHAHFLAAARARLAGDDRTAGEQIAMCLAVDSTNLPAYFITLWQLGRAHLLVARGWHRQATHALAVVLARAGSHYWSFLQFSALLSRIWLRIREHRENEAAADLGLALVLARNGAYRNCDPWWDREAMGEIERFSGKVAHDEASLSVLLARQSS
jgi:hypothetical protein